MPKISLDEFCSHWDKGRGSLQIVSQFEKNIYDFTIITGHYSKRFFQTSFLVGGFYGTGTTWQPCKSRWSERFPHPILVDTGRLKGSFNEENTETFIDGRRDNGKKIFRRKEKYVIKTTEFTVPEKKKRGISKNKEKGKSIGYAAVHNSDPRLTNYKVNQYSSKRPVQRQFMGFNRKLDDDIHNHFIPILFRGFPT